MARRPWMSQANRFHGQEDRSWTSGEPLVSRTRHWVFPMGNDLALESGDQGVIQPHGEEAQEALARIVPFRPKP